MYFDLWKTLGELLPDDPRLALFLAVLTVTSAVSGKLISAMLSEPFGRAEIWFALSDRALERKVQRAGYWLRRRVAHFGPHFLGVRVARTGPQISDGVIAACLLLVSVGPSLSALFGQTAAWGGGTFSYPNGETSGFPTPATHGFLLTSAVVSASCLVLPLRAARAMSFLSVALLATSLYFFPPLWYSFRETMFTAAIVAVALTGVMRSGLAALLATAFLLSLSLVLSTRSDIGLEATAPAWAQLAALGIAIGAVVYSRTSREAALFILPPTLVVFVLAAWIGYEQNAPLKEAFQRAWGNPLLVHATLAFATAFVVSRLVRMWLHVSLSSAVG
ncbi:MAG: hypothetical protein MRY81_21830 [Donghicola eburneus]|nr:hypothetical protein [Donghicola eburneus]MCI5042301.1 hypothetical protein [Donghicola eburneus]